MTTLTIQEDIDLSKTDFRTYDELVNFVIETNSKLNIEELTDDETKLVNESESFQKFKKVVNSL